MPRSRGEWVGIGFMAVWMTFWTSAILVALYVLGGRVLHGDLPAALVLVIWLAAAGFGLWSAARRLYQLLVVGRTPRRPIRRHRWQDGMGPPDPR
jgi:hypothetical protein